MKKYSRFLLVLAMCCLVAACARRGNVMQAPEQVPVDSLKRTGVITEKTLDAQTAGLEHPPVWRVESGANKLENIYFDFDRYFIRADQTAVLERNAAILKDVGNRHISVEGNCDDRGTIEYNIALGQKRAEEVRGYYIRLGVPGYRINAISYGEEHQVCTEATEACWRQNRRVDTKF